MSKVQALRQLPSVRERCEKVYKLAQEGKVEHFMLDEGRYEDIIQVCAKAINVCPTCSSDYALMARRIMGPITLRYEPPRHSGLAADSRYNLTLGGDTLPPLTIPTF
jgi:hypothetical protein